MAQFQHGDVAINYQVSGAGFPLLLIAPGGMNSSIDWWSRAALDPLAVYADDFQLIAMDQRNAGTSRTRGGRTSTTSSGSWTTSASSAATSSAAASGAPTRWA